MKLISVVTACAFLVFMNSCSKFDEESIDNASILDSDIYPENENDYKIIPLGNKQNRGPGSYNFTIEIDSSTGDGYLIIIWGNEKESNFLEFDEADKKLTFGKISNIKYDIDHIFLDNQSFLKSHEFRIYYTQYKIFVYYQDALIASYCNTIAVLSFVKYTTKNTFRIKSFTAPYN